VVRTCAAVAGAIHPLLEEIHGGKVAAHSFIPRDECELIYESIQSCGATRAVETGMAFGVSSLCVADALSRNAPSFELISIDPVQTTDWQSAGVHLLARAGLAVTLLEEPSQLALPRLAAAGERFGFGFIDGWHTFDHTLIDFFYIDMMLANGGIIVLDDVGYPAINAAVRFILANRSYELVKALTYDVPAALLARRRLKRVLRPLARTDRDPSPEHDRLFRGIEQAHAVAIRKVGPDTRRFDHYERF
jgi:predicted O-methyltransferase YrrM